MVLILPKILVTYLNSQGFVGHPVSSISAFSTRDDFCPQETFSNSEYIFMVTSGEWGRDAKSIWWLEARNIAKQPSRHGQLPTRKNYLFALVGKTCCKMK